MEGKAAKGREHELSCLSEWADKYLQVPDSSPPGAGPGSLYSRAIPKPRKARAGLRWAQGWLCQSESRSMVPAALTQLSGSGFETSAQQWWFSSWLLFIYWKLLLITQKEKQLERVSITQFYSRQDNYGWLQTWKKKYMNWKAPNSKHFFFTFSNHLIFMLI